MKKVAIPAGGDAPGKMRIVPSPASIKTGEGFVDLGPGWGVEAPGDVPAGWKKWLEGFGIPGRAVKKKVKFRVEGRDDGSYGLKISSAAVEVKSGGDRGFFYALQTARQLSFLSEDGFLPECEVEDSPGLAIRGFHVNFWSFRMMDVREAEYVFEKAAELKLNTLLLEYGDRFPFKKHRAVRAPSALSEAEVAMLMEQARLKGLEVIPLQQCLGHMDYLLKHAAYGGISEEDDHRDQLCPLNPRGFEVFTEMASEIIEAHPGIRYFHIGGDEARRLGACPLCSEKSRKKGVGRLYVDYINKVAEWLGKRNLMPVVADDMLCKHPEALGELNKNTVLMYWDYWTVGERVPYVTARYQAGGIRYDKRWLSEWSGELPELEREIMMKFARPADLERELGGQFMDVYGKYMGGGFPKYIRGFPYIEFYRDRGFDVICAPTCLGNTDSYYTLPNYKRFIPNIRAAAVRSREAGALGVITTAWYNYHPLLFHNGLAAGARFSWEAGNIAHNGNETFIGPR